MNEHSTLEHDPHYAATVASVAAGECPLEVLADWLEERGEEGGDELSVMRNADNGVTPSRPDPLIAFERIASYRGWPLGVVVAWAESHIPDVLDRDANEAMLWRSAEPATVRRFMDRYPGSRECHHCEQLVQNPPTTISDEEWQRARGSCPNCDGVGLTANPDRRRVLRWYHRWWKERGGLKVSAAPRLGDVDVTGGLEWVSAAGAWPDETTQLPEAVSRQYAAVAGDIRLPASQAIDQMAAAATMAMTPCICVLGRVRGSPGHPNCNRCEGRGEVPFLESWRWYRNVADETLDPEGRSR